MYLSIYTGEMTVIPFFKQVKVGTGLQARERKNNRILKRRRKEARVKRRVYLFIYVWKLIVH